MGGGGGDEQYWTVYYTDQACFSPKTSILPFVSDLLKKKNVKDTVSETHCHFKRIQHAY